MEQQQTEVKLQDHKYKTVNKVIWFTIPLVAMLVIGIILGVYINGNKIERSLKENANLKPCIDSDGKVWIKEDKRLENISLTSQQPINYNPS